VQVQQRQHLGDLRRAAHPAGQDRADVLHSLAGGRVGAPVIHPRAADLDRPGAHRQRPGWGVAVADHQPPAALVDLVGVGGQVGVHLSFQGLGQHPAGAFAGQLVQAQAQLGLGLLVGDYTQHAAFLPRRRCPPASSVHITAGRYAAFSCSGRSTRFRYSSTQVRLEY
jgi:hypothetical protein